MFLNWYAALDCTVKQLNHAKQSIVTPLMLATFFYYLEGLMVLLCKLSSCVETTIRLWLGIILECSRNCQFWTLDLLFQWKEFPKSKTSCTYYMTIIVKDSSHSKFITRNQSAVNYWLAIMVLTPRSHKQNATAKPISLLSENDKLVGL